jgi:8-hydroxy-5-deazaflavin:NADPH oxidoreductase
VLKERDAATTHTPATPHTPPSSPASSPNPGPGWSAGADTENTRATGPVAIVGASGALGFGLAVRLGRAGVPVVVGSRDAERIEQTISRAREIVPEGSFSGFDNEGAVRAADIVILSVPFGNQYETLLKLQDVLRPGQLLIDATVPLAATVGAGATRMLGVWQGSAAEQALELAPAGVSVVSALHTVSAASLGDLDHPLEQDVFICGDSREDKRRAAGLLELIGGLRCVDCGHLEMARITESLTALMIAVKIEHATHVGIRMTGLPDTLWD